MIRLFQYNWQVRNEWFDWCSGIPTDELLKVRTGGVGGILKTLFHIIDVEHSWIQALSGETVVDPEFEDYMSLQLVREFSDRCHEDVKRFVEAWSDEKDNNILIAPWNPQQTYSRGEVLRHVIAHEIHHVGQLSVWAKDLGKPSVSANFIGRALG